ncbi:hypothetical protein B0J11DRAFT_576874 [Dendryphion nanum]|uniref:Uncharacterized protein n=1 Tax=Dendryphion nanum TaxID=256645 RepID=A0A9P9E6G1_9PLEO|nr:hypothetical protein B0J11DRAFT_576874 [Dendryphion nanum]
MPFSRRVRNKLRLPSLFPPHTSSTRSASVFTTTTQPDTNHLDIPVIFITPPTPISSATYHELAQEVAIHVRSVQHNSVSREQLEGNEAELSDTETSIQPAQLSKEDRDRDSDLGGNLESREHELAVENDNVKDCSDEDEKTVQEKQDIRESGKEINENFEGNGCLVFRAIPKKATGNDGEDDNEGESTGNAATGATADILPKTTRSVQMVLRNGEIAYEACDASEEVGAPTTTVIDPVRLCDSNSEVLMTECVPEDNDMNAQLSPTNSFIPEHLHQQTGTQIAIASAAIVEGNAWHPQNNIPAPELRIIAPVSAHTWFTHLPYQSIESVMVGENCELELAECILRFRRPDFENDDEYEDSDESSHWDSILNDDETAVPSET